MLGGRSTVVWGILIEDDNGKRTGNGGRERIIGLLPFLSLGRREINSTVSFSANKHGVGQIWELFTYKFVVDGLNFPLECVCFAQRGDEELRKAVQGTVQLAWDHIKVVRRVLLHTEWG